MTVREYGAWPSPLAASDVFSSTIGRGACMSADGVAYWVEVRPGNDGRALLLRDDGSGPTAISREEHDVRTRFHEYGGGAYGVTRDQVVYVDFADQRVWRVAVSTGSGPHPITPEAQGAVRFSCFRIDESRGVVWCLREDQRDPALEPVTSMVTLDLDGPNHDFGTTAVAGRERPVDGEELPADVDSPPDFLLDLQLSPDGSRIAWVSWNHPDMAWHGTWLRVARVDQDGALADHQVIAGSRQESIEEPRWRSDHELLFLSDRTGWSNLYRAELASAGGVDLTAITQDELEYGRPRWVADMGAYDVLPDGRVASTRCVDGFTGLVVLDPQTGDLSEVPTGLAYVAEVRALDADHVLVGTGMFMAPREALVVDLRDGSLSPVGDAERAAPPESLASTPELVSWGVEDGASASGYLYRPRNGNHTGPDGSRPPLIVTIHGGPTGAAIPGYTQERAYWTSRGFAVLDVNYGGSTGFGRAFRERLEGMWGLVDVSDIVAGVEHLVRLGEVDRERVVTRGGSAGGYTTLMLLTSSSAFAAGTSLFGVTDIGALARDTHKLESRYMWRLVAPWPQGRAVYDERSPINQLDRLRTPLLILQGSDDRVVPPNQAEMLAESLRAQRLPVAMIIFDGEGHGFRRPENQVRSLEAELSFYCQILDLPHPEDLPRLEVENLAQ